MIASLASLLKKGEYVVLTVINIVIKRICMSINDKVESQSYQPLRMAA